MDSNSKNYHFYISYNNSSSIKLFDSKSLKNGLKKFIRENTADEFELRVKHIPIKTNSPSIKNFTRIQEVQSLIDSLEKNSKKPKTYKATLIIYDNEMTTKFKYEMKSIFDRKAILQKIIKNYLKTEIYELTKTHEQGYEFTYLDSGIFKSAKIIFE
ncbi:MAG: hypothetical protein Q7T48_10215 [Cellvibrio sp.]|uniref:hypothetical protein n=1 Tax=Cellvibrio sp. TaxID=1965322 RepID=UPI00271EAA65|nr:hypothetical protein [Cellvibrio sp.]